MPFMMYPGKGHGFANTLIHLCDFFSNHPDGVVHESIKDYEIGEWITFNFPITERTDLPEYKPNIFINQHTVHSVHPLISKLISPSDKLQTLIDQHMTLINGIDFGMHIRRGAHARDSRAIVQSDNDVFASDAAIQLFKSMSKGKKFFLASDSPETKKMFPNARTIDTTIAVVHDECQSVSTKDRRNIFLDFFLLSKCPRLILTGGNFPNLPGLSTFGYMAAMYGSKPWQLVQN
jgi:hypothetical protein